MPPPEASFVVQAWLGRARVDLGTARTLLRDRTETAAWAACFHAQQAAEKFLKATLAASGTEPPHVHNLVALHARLSPTLELAADVDLATLTTYATGPRYAFSDFPAEPEPTWSDAELALAWATAVGQAVQARLAAGGVTSDKRETSDGT